MINLMRKSSRYPRKRGKKTLLKEQESADTDFLREGMRGRRQSPDLSSLPAPSEPGRCSSLSSSAVLAENDVQE